jgi:hypothetical protein
MESLAKSDIFFFITTLCVFLITALLLVILWNVLRITKSLREIITRIKDETDGIADDIATLRTDIKENNFGFKPLLSFFRGKKARTTKRSANSERGSKNSSDGAK